jgi:hypothetical protein
MRLYGAIQKVEPQDDGTVRVHGIATSEAVDDQGEIVRAEAMRAAIPDYMRFPALREMHQLSAAGTTLEAEVCEDGTTRIVAHVVDPVAVAKVKNQVYRGFSIGGRVTQREASNPKSITSLVLNEISLVDRPANPEAIFDCWKAAIIPPASGVCADLVGSARSQTSSTELRRTQEPFNSPIQIWACGDPDHRHLAKIDAVRCLEKRAAEGIPAKPATAAPESAAPGEILSVAEADGAALAPEVSTMLAMAAGQSEVTGIAALLEKGKPNVRKLDLLAKTQHLRSDQALVDMAHLACDKCLEIGGLSADEEEHLGKARDCLSRAGAAFIENSPVDPAGDSEDPRNRRSETVKVLGIVAAVLGKRGRAHQHIMDMAHACLGELTDGMVCEEATKAGARHSKETMEHFISAHRHLVAAGAECEIAGTTGSTEPDGVEREGTEYDTAKGALVEDLAKDLAGERAEKAALVDMLGEIVPMLERLTKRVDDIARTPLPPLTIAKGTISVSKQQDGGDANRHDAGLSSEAIASALAKMSKEEQTLMLIKASYANPIRVPGAAADDR